MIDRELLGKIKDKTDKDDDSFIDVPPDWLEAEQKQARKKALEKGCLATILIILVSFLLLIVVAVSTSNQDGAQIKHQVKRGPGWRDVKPSSFPQIERRTSAGVGIEKGADIDYRVDSDKLINLSVRQIRSNGYRCNSLSSIDLYSYNKSIVVRCNGGDDKYRIYPSSGQVTRE